MLDDYTSKITVIFSNDQCINITIPWTELSGAQSLETWETENPMGSL